MSVSTMIVYSIFYLVNHSAVPFMQDSTTAVRYESMQQCKDALRDLRSNLAIELGTYENKKNVSAQDRTTMELNSQRAQSMTCEAIEIDLPPPVQEAKVSAVPAGAKTLVLWKIGRIDQANIFHGTAYNEYAYDDESACIAAYANTQGKVFDKAIADGATNVQASSMLNTFVATYKCDQVALKASEIARQPVEAPAPQPAQMETQQPRITPPAPVVAPQYQQPNQSAQPQYVQQQYEQQPMEQLPQPQYQRQVRQQGYAPSAFIGRNYPIRPVYIAESVQSPWGSITQFVYPTPYTNVAECWSAVDALFGTQPTERRNSAQCVFSSR